MTVSGVTKTACLTTVKTHIHTRDWKGTFNMIQEHLTTERDVSRFFKMARLGENVPLLSGPNKHSLDLIYLCIYVCVSMYSKRLLNPESDM